MKRMLLKPKKHEHELVLRVESAGVRLGTHFVGRTLLCPGLRNGCVRCEGQLPRFYVYHAAKLRHLSRADARTDEQTELWTPVMWEAPERLHVLLQDLAPDGPPWLVKLGRPEGSSEWSVVKVKGYGGGLVATEEIFADVLRLFRLPSSDWAYAASKQLQWATSLVAR